MNTSVSTQPVAAEDIAVEKTYPMVGLLLVVVAAVLAYGGLYLATR